jgi:anti-anti-sigma regulatory factor
MYHAQLDKSKRLLKIICTQRVSPEEVKRCADELPALLAELQPRFRLLTDLSELDSMDLGCVPHLKRIMDLCNTKGVKTVVRVIPDPHKDIGLNIMSLFHYGRDVHIVTCDTLEEAIEVLAEA